jgi:hypothetical protein
MRGSQKRRKAEIAMVDRAGEPAIPALAEESFHN